MKIKTKYRLMYVPLYGLLILPCVILGAIAIPSLFMIEQLQNYKEWCQRKAGMFVKTEYGTWVYNPKYIEEENKYVL